MILALLPLSVAADAVAPPDVDAQLWRLPADATATLWADDAAVRAGPEARVSASWMRDPVVWVWDDTGERVSVVQDAVGLDVVAGWGLGPARLAVDVPVWPYANGEYGGGAGLGDVALDAKLRVWPAKAPVGLAVTGRVALPTASDGLPLGSSGVVWDVALVADAELGPVRLAFNVGHHGVPDVALSNVDVGDRGFARLGAGYAVTDGAGVSLDLAGQVTWADPGNAAGAPVEALLGGWFDVTDTISLRAGVGRGLTRGIGAPSARAVLAVGWAPPPAKKAAGPKARARPEPTIEPVHIGRGGDLPPGLVHLRVRGPDGQTVPARWSLAGEDAGALHDGRGIAEVDPGSWRLVVDAPGYATHVQMLEVETGLTSALEITLRVARVTLTKDRMSLTTPLRFHGAALASNEDPILDEISAILRSKPEIIGVRIEGYVARTGSLEQDLTMSGLRAAAVKDWLVEHGVETERLVVVGYGSGRPLDPARPDDPRNDRVELVITAMADPPAQ